MSVVRYRKSRLQCASHTSDRPDADAVVLIRVASDDLLPSKRAKPFGVHIVFPKQPRSRSVPRLHRGFFPLALVRLT
jgi:hypothetical protein